MPALSAKNVLTVASTTPPGIFGLCRLVLELFARPHNDPVIRIGSKFGGPQDDLRQDKLALAQAGSAVIGIEATDKWRTNNILQE